ncbi:MAG: type I-C CRISPR-associated protein Cas8c/Csd1, partial [Syntrophobacteraceae bacterium]
MILQALSDYYRRVQSEGLIALATAGFQKQSIPFVVVLDRQGRFESLLDTRTGEGKKKVARQFTVPKGAKKTSGVASNLLWDTPAYVFGRPKPDSKKDTCKLAGRAVEQHRCFTNTIRECLN